MIVVSLPLILVAVGLLALGLSGGSSNLLISSIVASLLAAVALVIGARQTAGNRRAAQETVPGPAAPEFAAEGPGHVDDFPPAGATFAAESAGSARDTVRLDPVGTGPAGMDPAGFDSPDLDSAGFDSPDLDPADLDAGGFDAVGLEPDADADAAYHAGRRDAAAGMTAAASGARRDDAGRAGEAEPDYERAADAIHSARSDDEQAWRRSAFDEPVGVAGHAEATAHAEAADEFAEPDEDDPADEPLPQSVRPADAVRVARMDAEVLVVDGRPRYHVPDCPHLIGRLTEPIPVDEAVELGFSPCGLCRPVDRLVGAAAPR